MKIRLPACGGVMSLDTLIEQSVGHDAARDALLGALKLDALGVQLIRYMGLHRPEKRELVFERVATLLTELLGEIHAGRFERDGIAYEAPRACWAWGLSQLFDMRDAGKLKLPLKGHGLLREIMTRWLPASAPGTGLAQTITEGGRVPRQVAPSKTLEAVSALAARARGGQ